MPRVQARRRVWRIGVGQRAACAVHDLWPRRSVGHGSMRVSCIGPWPERQGQEERIESAKGSGSYRRSAAAHKRRVSALRTAERATGGNAAEVRGQCALRALTEGRSGGLWTEDRMCMARPMGTAPHLNEQYRQEKTLMWPV
jgi:hypothetical protein